MKTYTLIKTQCPHCNKIVVPERKPNNWVCSNCRGIIATKGDKLWKKLVLYWFENVEENKDDNSKG